MKKGYWVVSYRSVSDETALKKYGELAIPAIEAGGGKALIRTADAVESREAGLKQRVVVMDSKVLTARSPHTTVLLTRPR